VKQLAATCAAGVVLALSAALPATAQTEVKVLLLRHQFEAVVAAAGGLIVRPYQAGSAPLLTPDITTVLDIRPQQDGLLLADSVPAQSEILISPLTDATLTLDGLAYRGSILVARESDNSLRLINLVDLEKYLYSVVGSEVAADTPASALQAQAIVARTYAVTRLGAHTDLGFDLRAGDLDQAYNGTDAESESVVNAVDATRGVVMVSGNHLVDAYYSACDGGFTSEGAELGDPQPYLQAVRDPYCPFSPYMAWTADVPASTVLTQLAESGALPEAIPLDSLVDVRPGPADSSGRLQSVNFVTAQNILSVAATSFRAAAGNRLVKSTKIQSLSYAGGMIHVSGSGYGHGVGMCQLGARGMAESGLGVYAIINFYYPGVLLTQLASYQRFELARSANNRIARNRIAHNR
jgi:stage II sporulation protein D